MKIHRFFLEDICVKNNALSIEDKAIFNQIKNVLKIKAGEQIVFFNKDTEVLCMLSSYDKKSCFLDVLETSKNNVKRDFYSILYCSILKKDNFDLIVQKASEIGVYKIVPVIFDRTIKTDINYERLERIAIEASEQSFRKDFVIIDEIIKFKDINLKDNNFNIMFNMDCPDFNEFFDSNKIKKDTKIAYFIGPEGGFTESEIEFAKKNKFNFLSLGKNILRAETAAIVSSFLVENL